MIIGVDLDGVIYDTEDYYRTYAHLYDINFVHNGLVNSSEMDVHKRYAWNNDIADDFYEKYTSVVLESAPIKPGAICVLNELKKLGHTIFIITLRGLYRDYEIDITEKRMKEDNIPYDKIFYNQQNKVKTCKDLGINLMIEDNHKNVVKLAESGIKCMHLRGAGLSSVNHPNVSEIQNWAQVLEYILKLNNKAFV